MVPRYLKCISTPRTVPQIIAVTISYIAILAIFALDVMTGSEIVLQILYIFPIALVSFHCKQAGKRSSRKDRLIDVRMLLRNSSGFCAEKAAINSFTGNATIKVSASTIGVPSCTW